MTRHGFFTFAVGPHVMAAATSEEPPAALSKLPLEVAALHMLKCTPNGVQLFQRLQPRELPRAFGAEGTNFVGRRTFVCSRRRASLRPGSRAAYRSAKIHGVTPAAARSCRHVVGCGGRRAALFLPPEARRS